MSRFLSRRIISIKASARSLAERGQISVHLPDRSLLLAGSARLQREHVRQLVGIRIELARALGRVELGLHTVGAQVLADRVPRQTCAP
jgi:hypothetical protein